MSPLLEPFAKALSAGGILALPIALLGGLVSALNPCCLALYPAAAATCCGVRESAAQSPQLGRFRGRYGNGDVCVRGRCGTRRTNHVRWRKPSQICGRDCSPRHGNASPRMDKVATPNFLDDEAETESGKCLRLWISSLTCYRSLRDPCTCLGSFLRGFQREYLLRSAALVCIRIGRGDSSACCGHYQRPVRPPA